MRKLTNRDRAAIHYLNEYIKQIPTLTILEQAEAWKSKVLGSLQTWLGKDHPLTDTFDHRGGVKVLNHKEFRLPNNDVNASMLVQVREYIEATGVLKEPDRPNWF